MLLSRINNKRKSLSLWEALWIEGQALKSKVTELIDMLELKDAENKLASQLSGGMEKRLDIACSIIHDPQLLLLDEPTLELDPILRGEIMKLIYKINQKGVTILMASHLLGGIEILANNIAILHEGEILRIDSPERLRESYGLNEKVYLRTSP